MAAPQFGGAAFFIKKKDEIVHVLICGKTPP